MQKRILFSCFMLLVFSVVTTAQWEKLPLYGGHADRLVQSKFDSNLVFAIVQNAGIYYTTELYKNWKPLFKDESNPPFIDILDLEITKNNTLIVIANKKCWRSTDWGANWQHLNVPYTGSAWSYSTIETSRSGLITAYFDGDQKIYHSTDDGISWTTISVPQELLGRILGFYSDPDSGKLIMLHGFIGRFARSIDGGQNWIQYNFQFIGDVLKPQLFNRDGNQIIGIWADIFISSDQPHIYRYYESLDTGRTWVQRNSNILYTKNNSGSFFNKFVVCPSGKMLFCASQKLYVSYDSGITWNGYDDKHVWDILISNDKTVASFTLDGVLLSTNEGENWIKPYSLTDFSTFSSLQFRSATRKVFFSIIGDEEEDQSSLYELKQSVDAGQTWEKLFISTSIHSLNAISSPEIKYYLVSDGNSIISGKLNQSIPDTILVVDSNSFIYNFQISKQFPESFYVSASKNSYELLLTSEDTGKTWNFRNPPPYRYNGFSVYLSNLNRDLLIGVGYETFGSIDFLCGLWMSSNHGSSWQQVNVSLQTPIALIENDVLFRGDELSFSTDYGKTWVRNDTGIDDSLRLQSFSFITQQNQLFITQSNGWYYFSNGKWNQLKDKTGVQIKRDSPNYMELVDQDLYCSFGYHGLHKISISPLTSVKEKRDENIIKELFECYPNPANKGTTFLFSLKDGEVGIINIMNSLGQLLRRMNLPNSAKSIYWDGRDESGNELKSGIYYCTLNSNRKTIFTVLTIIK